MAGRSLGVVLRQGFRVSAAISIVVLGLITAAFAATGSVPLFPRHHQPRGARIAISTAHGASVQSPTSVAFHALNMAPGEMRTAEVSAANTGDRPGVFTLTASDLKDTPARLLEPLSAVLNLAVLDITQPGTATTVYAGSVAGLSSTPLGTWAAGAPHAYRLVLAYPLGRPSGLDNRLQGAGTTVTFSWDGVLSDVRPTTSTTTSTSPAHARPGPRKPRIWLRLRRAQHWRGGALRATVGCRTACVGRVSATVVIEGKSHVTPLRSVLVRMRRSARRTVRLQPVGRDVAVIAKALRTHQHMTVKVRWRAKARGTTLVLRARGRIRS